jgi:hypothetical protein
MFPFLRESMTDAEAALLHPRAYRLSTFELQPTPKLQPKLKPRGRIDLVATGKNLGRGGRCGRIFNGVAAAD